MLTQNICIDENSTFKSAKEYVDYKNKRNLIDILPGIINDKERVILKNPTDTIYNEINFINGKKFVER